MNARTTLIAAALATAVTSANAAAAGPTATTAASPTRNCSSVSATVKGKRSTAHGIRSTGMVCRKAATVVQSCLRDTLRGWRVSHAPSPDDTNPKGLTGLDRGAVHISFQIRGRGGCG